MSVLPAIRNDQRLSNTYFDFDPPDLDPPDLETLDLEAPDDLALAADLLPSRDFEPVLIFTGVLGLPAAVEGLAGVDAAAGAGAALVSPAPVFSDPLPADAADELLLELADFDSASAPALYDSLR